MKKWALLTVLVLAGGIMATAQEPQALVVHVPNFHMVVPGVYRGAAPGDSGVQDLASMGVKTIIDMRGPSGLTASEERTAKSLGLRYHNIPMSGFWSPDPTKEQQIQSLLADKSLYPIFLHCRAGKDRTGAAIALFRMRQECWTYDDAVAEAYRYGMSRRDVFMRRYLVDQFQTIKSACQPAVTAEAGHPAGG